MDHKRREIIKTGLAGGVTLAFTPVFSLSAIAQETTDTIPIEGGELIIEPINHASLVLETDEMAIYVDPVGEAAAYEGFPPPNLILITHEHGDHYAAETLNAVVGENTQIITNPAVYDMLPEGLRAIASPLANGESAEVMGVGIEAIPAYNTTEDRLQYHPEGRDNGYVLSLSGARVYIAGDTEDIPEMRALENIDLAFVPMNLPYTMTVEQAASAVNEFAPGVVYPYHYQDSDVERFKSLVEEGGGETEVRLAGWY